MDAKGDRHLLFVRTDVGQPLSGTSVFRTGFSPDAFTLDTPWAMTSAASSRSFSIAWRFCGRVASLAVTWTTSSSPLSRDAIRAARRTRASAPWYDATLGLTMLIGRCAPIVLALAIAGSLAGARVHARTRATLDTAGPTFMAFLLGVIVIVGGLIYFPMLILGPIGERIIG